MSFMKGAHGGGEADLFGFGFEGCEVFLDVGDFFE